MVFRLTKPERVILRKHTPWIISPVDRSLPSASVDSATGNDYESKSEPQNLQSRSEDSSQQHRNEGLPAFKRHPKAGAIELFYDLFFVANLTTFTRNHEVNDAETLKSYIGFFTLMWFTWLATSLYDVRFSFDSVYDRICKAIAFGIMTGFAVVSPQYVPELIDDADPAADTSFAFRAMALILMVSRLALMVQYGVVLWFVRDYGRTLPPFMLSMAIHFIAAVVFLGTYFGFPEEGQSTNKSAYAAWYTITVVEALAMIIIPIWWHEVGFQHSNLVERVGLLTLIIIGEGVIGMTQSVATILTSAVTVSSETIGTITAALLLIYFVWMLYFDQIDDDRFGVLRQPLWAIFHYPLHVEILLTLEGSTQFIIWNQIVQCYYSAKSVLYFPLPSQTAAAYAKALGENITVFNNAFRGNNFANFYNYSASLTAISQLDLNTTTGQTQLNKILNRLVYALYKFMFVVFDVNVPENTTGETRSIAEQDLLLLERFETVFLYFLISAGGSLIILGAMYFVGTKHKSRMEYAAVAVRVLMGVALSLVTLTAVHLKNKEAGRLQTSPWMIPMVVLVHFFVIALDNILMWAWADKKFGRKEMHQMEETFD